MPTREEEPSDSFGVLWISSLPQWRYSYRSSLINDIVTSNTTYYAAIHVNPWYLEGVASGINSAILMEEEEKAIRVKTHRKN